MEVMKGCRHLKLFPERLVLSNFGLPAGTRVDNSVTPQSYNEASQQSRGDVSLIVYYKHHSNSYIRPKQTPEIIKRPHHSV
jgi:hypothetical protein